MMDILCAALTMTSPELHREFTSPQLFECVHVHSVWLHRLSTDGLKCSETCVVHRHAVYAIHTVCVTYYAFITKCFTCWRNSLKWERRCWWSVQDDYEMTLVMQWGDCESKIRIEISVITMGFLFYCDWLVIMKSVRCVYSSTLWEEVCLCVHSWCVRVCVQGSVWAFGSLLLLLLSPCVVPSCSLNTAWILTQKYWGNNITGNKTLHRKRKLSHKSMLNSSRWRIEYIADSFYSQASQ